MKIELTCYNNDFWYYDIDELDYSQEEFDYIFKYLDFDKLDQEWSISFNNKEVGKWFSETYINIRWLGVINLHSPEGYKWLRDNWGKCLFWVFVYYNNKQELKTIINRVINIKLINQH